MAPAHLRFGGGAADTLLHPLVAVALLIAAVLILVLPRNKAIAPFLLAFFTIPGSQVVVIGGLHFPVIRILILTVLARMVLLPSGRKFPGGLNALDTVVALWAVSSLIMVNLQFMQLPAFIKTAGDFIDAFGGYVAVRYLIPDRDTVRRTIKVLAVVCLIQGAFMVSEQFTRQNVLSFAGGAAPELRNGHVRSQGTLGGLYGGTFAGVLIPVFFAHWKERRLRMAAYAGLAGATAMVVASHASTSVLAFAASLLGLAFWPLRKYMRLVRWGIVAALAGLQLVMKSPVWWAIKHVDVAGGSSSWQRAYLIDMTMRHFSNWWLIGYKDYPAWGWGAWDLVNQFVAVAVTGGLLTLILYIMIFTRSLGAVGTARKRVHGNRRQEWFLWCLGSTFVAIIVSSFGINYMIQLLMCLFPLLAFVSVTCLAPRKVLALTSARAGEEQFVSARDAQQWAYEGGGNGYMKGA